MFDTISYVVSYVMLVILLLWSVMCNLGQYLLLCGVVGLLFEHYVPLAKQYLNKIQWFHVS